MRVVTGRRITDGFIGNVAGSRNLRLLYPKTAIRIRKGRTNGVELGGLKLDEDKKRVMEIMQQVWEDYNWLH